MNVRKTLVLVLLTIVLALSYFLYRSWRSQVELYMMLQVLKPANAPGDSVPYWYSDAIEIGDRDISPFGQVNAVILDKNIYKGSSIGGFVYVLAKVNAVQDRTGKYRVKNRPISIGQTIGLELTKVPSLWGMVISIDTMPPINTYTKVTMRVNGRSAEKWIADSLKPGSEIKDAKGNTVARLKEKIVTMSSPQTVEVSGQSMRNIDSTKRDIEAIVEIAAKQVDGMYVYAETTRLVVDELVWLAFPEVNFYPRITALLKTDPLQTASL